MTTTLQEIKKHNERVKSALARAKKGEIINLTDLLISKEKLLQKLAKESDE